MNARTISLIFGVIFVGVGILGFIPNPLVAADGIFSVNALHNLVHIATGAVFLIGALRYPYAQAKLLKTVGIAYVAVTILGFLNSDGMLLGLIHINTPDRWLHLALAVVILGAGIVFGEPKTKPALNHS